jgi:hypothetical protein
MLRRTSEAATMISPRTWRRSRQPAASAAGGVFGISVGLAGFGVAAAVLVIARLFESWRIAPGSTSHAISIFGQRLSYPAANAGAITVTALAVLGLLMAGAAAWQATRELRADRAFRRSMATRSPVPFDGAWLIEETRPQAFCAGLLRTRVYISSGTLSLLPGPELAAVLAHEREHARRHDPLRLACSRVLAAGLFFTPAMRHLSRRQHELAELAADEAVVHAAEDRSALASAMLRFSEAGDAGEHGIDPERVDHLLGERVEWRLPVLLCIAAAATLASLIALAVLAAHTAAGSATLAPPFLSSQPCIAVLALIPATAALVAVAHARGRGLPAARVNPPIPAHD